MKNELLETGLLEFLGKTAGDLRAVKDSLAEDFQKIGNFVVCTSGEIGQLHNLAEPYMEYYFSDPGGSGRPPFVEDVLAPGRLQVAESFDAVIRLMSENDEISALALHDLEKMISLHVDIRALICGIRELHASGGYTVVPAAGFSSGPGDDIEAVFQGLIDECQVFLNGFRKDFDEYSGIRKWMHTVHSRYLKKMKGRFSEIFDETIPLFGHPAGEAGRVRERLIGLGEFSAALAERLQVEDLMRQDLEKVIFFGESLRVHLGAEVTGGDECDPSLAALRMVHDKIMAVRETLNIFSAEFPGACGSVHGLLLKCAPDEGLSQETDELLAAYKKFNRLESLLVSHTRKIIQMRQTLFGLHYRLLRSKGTFQEFLERILEVLDWFHDGADDAPTNGAASRTGLHALRAEAGRYLSMVASLNTGLDHITGTYNENYSGQEQMLQRILFSAKRISAQIYESLKQRKSMAGEIEEKAGGIAGGIAAADLPFKGLEDMRDGMGTLLAVIENLFPDAASVRPGREGEFDEGLKMIRERYERAGDPSDYRHMMTLSLFRDFAASKNDGVVFF